MPGWYDEEAQATHAATRAANARAVGGLGAGVRDSLGHKYWCAVCSRGFDRRKQQLEHEAGKRHRAAAEAAEHYWIEYCASAWFDPTEASEEVRAAVTGAWSLDAFLDGLPRRSRSRGSSSRPEAVLRGGGEADGRPDGILDPHVTLSALAPPKRARLWRYLRDLIPSRPGAAAARSHRAPAPAPPPHARHPSLPRAARGPRQRTPHRPRVRADLPERVAALERAHPRFARVKARRDPPRPRRDLTATSPRPLRTI